MFVSNTSQHYHLYSNPVFNLPHTIKILIHTCTSTHVMTTLQIYVTVPSVWSCYVLSWVVFCLLADSYTFPWDFSHLCISTVTYNFMIFVANLYLIRPPQINICGWLTNWYSGCYFPNFNWIRVHMYIMMSHINLWYYSTFYTDPGLLENWSWWWDLIFQWRQLYDIRVNTWLSAFMWDTKVN